jgi:hypothetical protein
MVLFMDWKDVPTPFDPVGFAQTPTLLRFEPRISSLNQVREKFWSFFGVFTEEKRKIAPSDKPPSQSMSRS